MTPNDNSLLNQAPSVLNIGIDGFNDSISQHGGRVEHLFWRPPGNADPALAWDLARLMGDPELLRPTKRSPSASSNLGRCGKTSPCALTAFGPR